MKVNIAETFDWITACRRCACESCAPGDESDPHFHRCTHGESCVESAEAMRWWIHRAQYAIAMVQSTIRETERKLKGDEPEPPTHPLI